MISSSQRHLFDIPEEVAYFNCAYNSPQLTASTNALIKGVTSKSNPWTRSSESFFDDAETIRNLSADLFGGDQEGYAILPSASYGLSTAARIIEPLLCNKHSILLMAEEFPSNVLPWQRIAKETGASITTVPTPLDFDWTKAIIQNMNEHTKVVAISSCHWTNGLIVDLIKVREACNRINAILVIDATQTLGAVPLSMDEVKPDFLVSAGYKWLLGPYGFGLMYVAPQWRDSRPLEETWLARSNAHNFAALVNYSDVYASGARRFDVGEKCTPTILPGAIAALQQLQLWGIKNITSNLSEINAVISSQLMLLGFKLPPVSFRSPHLFGAKTPSNYTGNLVTILQEHSIYISQRGDSLRFSPHLHINKKDIESLLFQIEKIVHS